MSVDPSSYSVTIGAYVNMLHTISDYFEQLNANCYVPVKMSNQYQSAVKAYETTKNSCEGAITSGTADDETLDKVAESFGQLVTIVNTESKEHNVTPPEVHNELSIGDKQKQLLTLLYNTTLENVLDRAETYEADTYEQVASMLPSHNDGELPVLSEAQEAAQNQFTCRIAELSLAANEANLNDALVLAPLIEEAGEQYVASCKEALAKQGIPATKSPPDKTTASSRPSYLSVVK